MSGFALPPEEVPSELKAQANAWVAQFAPLVLDDTTLTKYEVRQRLRLIDELRQTGPRLKERLASFEGSYDTQLSTTMENALSQIDSIETDLRKYLGRLAPGDPAGIVDLDTLQERLEERSARQELGVPTDLEIPPVLQLKLSPGNLGAAIFVGLFGMGWTAFTTVHAVLMIGGMMHAFGWIALLLLLFYSIFFAAGFAMFGAAYNMAATEEIELDGRQLTVRKKLAGIVREKKYTLAEGKAGLARIEDIQNNGFRPQGSPRTTTAIVMTDIEGRDINFGAQASPAVRESTVERLNAYLKVQK